MREAPVLFAMAWAVILLAIVYFGAHYVIAVIG